MRECMWMGRIAGAAVIGMVLSAGSAQAQVSPEIVKATAGDWLLAPEDGRQGCRVVLKAAETIGGYELAPSAQCAQVDEKLSGAVAWRFNESDGGLVFAGADRKAILSFSEKEDASYATAGEPGSVLLLVAAPTGVTAIPNAKDLFGDWAIQQPGGKTVCRAMLSDKAPEGGEESYAVVIDKACDKSVSALKLGSWRIEGLNVVLYGTDGDSLVFAPTGKGTFVADGAKPALTLSR